MRTRRRALSQTGRRQRLQLRGPGPLRESRDSFPRPDVPSSGHRAPAAVPALAWRRSQKCRSALSQLGPPSSRAEDWESQSLWAAWDTVARRMSLDQETHKLPLSSPHTPGRRLSSIAGPVRQLVSIGGYGQPAQFSEVDQPSTTSPSTEPHHGFAHLDRTITVRSLSCRASPPDRGYLTANKLPRVYSRAPSLPLPPLPRGASSRGWATRATRTRRRTLAR